MRLVKFILLSLTFFVGPLHAQTVTAKDPTSIVTALQDMGYRAQLEVDEHGDPLIRSAAAGSRFSIYFYACQENENCQDLLFIAWLATDNPPSFEAINSWNANKLTGTTFIDDDGDAAIQLFIPGAIDLTEDRFQQIMRRWDQALGAFMDFVFD
ncbi:MAG: YbjN domain-containing protein [Pseudomonadota bacterium]